MDASLTPSAAGYSWRFSIKQLLVALAAAGVLFMPANYFGASYLVAITLSLTLIALCTWAYRATAGGAVFVAFGGLFVGFFSAIF